MSCVLADEGLPPTRGILYFFREREWDNGQGPVRSSPGSRGQTDPAQRPLSCNRVFGGRTKDRDCSGSLRDQIWGRFGIKFKVRIGGKERGIVRDTDRFDVTATQRYGRNWGLLARVSVKYGYLVNREDDSVNPIRPDDKDGRFGRQKPDGLYG